MWSSMLSTVSVTSGIIFSAAEAKLTSLIGMIIFNNGIQFIIGEDETFRAMISTARNVSRDYKLPGRETVRGPLLDNRFENNIKNQHEKLLSGEDIYQLHFQDDGATIKDTPLLNILVGGVYLPVSVQNIVDFTGHITCGHKKDAKCFAESFFDTTDDLDPQKKLVDLHMFDGASVCRKAKTILKVVYTMLSCIVRAEYTCHNSFKGWSYI